MRRRDFLGTAVLGGTLFTIGSAWPRVFQSVADGPGPYGALSGVPDQNGWLLPEGFTSRVIATTGQAVPGTTYEWHVAPDGGATFATDDGGWIYVSNSEAFPGGAGMVRFDSAATVIDARPILSGTGANCAGGAAPWGTWLSCEEEPTGQVWECDPAGVAPAVVRPAMGSFMHEAAAVDPDRKVVYLTEDEPDGGLYRFIPSQWEDLSSGTLQVLTEVGGALGWATVAPTGPPVTRRQIASMKQFKGAEGAWYDTGQLYFTTKGDNRVWRYDAAAVTLTIVYDRATSRTPVLSGVDNVTVSRSGDVYVAEDGADMELVILSPEGEVAVFARLGVTASELTGPAFTPDGSRLYVSSQRQPGQTYEIRGPFRTSSGAGTSTSSTTTTTAATTTTTASTTTTSAAGITLTARAYRISMRRRRVELKWTDVPGSKVEIRRNGTRIKTTADDGHHIDELAGKNPGKFTYQVSAVGGSPKSNTATVTFT